MSILDVDVDGQCRHDASMMIYSNSIISFWSAVGACVGGGKEVLAIQDTTPPDFDSDYLVRDHTDWVGSRRIPPIK